MDDFTDVANHPFHVAHSHVPLFPQVCEVSDSFSLLLDIHFGKLVVEQAKEDLFHTVN